jgi:hypothetical protein
MNLSDQACQTAEGYMLRALNAVAKARAEGYEIAKGDTGAPVAAYMTAVMKTDSTSVEYVVLDFHNTPRELFEILDTIWEKSRWLRPFRFSYAWRVDAPRGVPPLSIDIPLSHRVASLRDYRDIADIVAMEFEEWGLNPVRRFFSAAVSAGIYDPPSAPGATFDPDICFMLGN